MITSGRKESWRRHILIWFFKKKKRQLLRVSKRHSAVSATDYAVWKDTLHFLNHWSVECVPRKGKLTMFVRNIFMCLFVGGRFRFPGGFAALFLYSCSIGVSSLILNRNWKPLVLRREFKKENNSGCLTWWSHRVQTVYLLSLYSAFYPQRHFYQTFWSVIQMQASDILNKRASPCKGCPLFPLWLWLFY